VTSITHNFNELSKTLNSLPKRYERNTVKEFRKMVIATGSNIIITTPVDTGKARGNWRSSIESPILSEIDRLDPSGEQAKLEVGTVSKQVTFRRMKFWLCNNLPYINRLNNGWSKKGEAAIPGYIERIVEGNNKQFAEIDLLS
jgi:hypothetical protein